MQFPRPPRHLPAHAPATFAVVATLLGAGSYPAHASYWQPSVTTSAVVCGVPDATETRPTRSWGAHNYSTKAIDVSCPISRPSNGAAVYGVMVYGNSVAFGERATCMLFSLRKQDGYMLALKFFSVGGQQAGMPGTWVYLEPAERHYDAVQEVRCTLPANNRAWLTAFEAFAG
jgi:hypothetical protein